MRGANQHLSDEEVEQLTGIATDVAVGALEGAMRHLERCEQCRFRMLSVQDLSGDLPTAPAGVKAGNSPCPPEARCLEVAAGLGTAAERKRYLEHAATCTKCGPLLKEAVEDVGMELTEEEEAKVAALSSARPEWQSNLAKEIAETAPVEVSIHKKTINPSPKFLFWPRWAAAFAALIVAAGGGWWAWIQFATPSVETLIEQAYAERRTIEPRIAGAKYAPMRVERGPEESNQKKRPALLKAEALISENLEKTPNDPVWLQANARADLLDGKYSDAIKSLQLALLSKPDSPELLTDLGSAYFQSADYGNAVEVLGKALAKSPNDPVIVFNHALACEKIFLLTQAVDDWQHYLKIDPTGGWAEEAKRHLDNVRQELLQHEHMTGVPLVNTQTLAATLNTSQTAIWERVDSRIEEYLDLAIREWLPLAFPAKQRGRWSSAAKESDAALKVLAQILSSQHQDSWLAELLKSPDTASFSAGIQALAEAVGADAAGNPDTALSSALVAEMQFERTNDKAGKLRAQLEEIYALHRKFSSVECLSRIAVIAPLLEVTHYQWIKIQVDLERYACQSSAEIHLASAGDSISSARTAARQFRYGNLYLRALGFAASRDAEMGLSEKSWEWDRLGLQEYWSGPYLPLRAQQFYDDLSIRAQDSEEWFLAVALGREAVSAIAVSPNRTGEAMERVRLAQSAMQARMWPEATKQYSQALGIFDSLDDGPAKNAFRANAEIGLAEAELQQGHIKSAEVHLLYARSHLPANFQEYQTWLALYSTAAKLRQQTGDLPGAERSCVAAVLIAEVGLQGIRSELERLRWSRAAATCYRHVVDWTLDQKRPVAALELWEWYLASAIRAPSYKAPIKDFSRLDMEAALPVPNEVAGRLADLRIETVITYAVLQNQVVAWLYDDRGIVWHKLGIESSQLKRAMALFSEQCSDPASDITNLTKDSRTLYDILVEPFSSNLDPKRTLVVEMDGKLGQIPFAALSDRNGRFLVDVMPITYLPGIGYRRLLRAGSSISHEDLALIVGDPLIPESDRASYPVLADADFEAEQVSREFTHAVLLTGAQATAARLLDNLLKAKVFHFAGHTRLQPGRSEFLLAMDGTGPSVIDSESIAVQQMSHLQLAVLSACSTDHDSSTNGGGADTIARAFLRNGVPEIVATRWQVDSAATSAFMSIFYREALRGRLVPAAIGTAMRETRRLPGYLHPYYWAAFDVFGRSGDTT